MLSAGIFMHFIPCQIESDILKQFMKFARDSIVCELFLLL